MGYKFEKLDVWQLAVEYIDCIYIIVNDLPKIEEFNLKSQIIRAATSVALNIAEGSINQSDAEQARFVNIASRSLVETVACLHLIHRRYPQIDRIQLRNTYRQSETLFSKLQALRKTLLPSSDKSLHEDLAVYQPDDALPF